MLCSVDDILKKSLMYTLYISCILLKNKKKKRGVVVWGLDRREQQDPIQGVCKTMPSNLVAVT